MIPLFLPPPCQVLTLEHVMTGILIERVHIHGGGGLHDRIGALKSLVISVFEPQLPVWQASALSNKLCSLALISNLSSFFSGCSKGWMPRSYRGLHQWLFAPNLREDRDDDYEEDELGRVRGQRQEIVEGRQVGLRRITLYQNLIQGFLWDLWFFSYFLIGRV